MRVWSGSVFCGDFSMVLFDFSCLMSSFMKHARKLIYLRGWFACVLHFHLGINIMLYIINQHISNGFILFNLLLTILYRFTNINIQINNISHRLDNTKHPTHSIEDTRYNKPSIHTPSHHFPSSNNSQHPLQKLNTLKSNCYRLGTANLSGKGTLYLCESLMMRGS